MLTLFFVVSANAETICPSQIFATRGGNDFCWARFSLGPDSALCLSKTLWQNWLKNPYEICGNWHGRWKRFSPPSNSLNKTNKTIKEWFYASSADQVSSIASTPQTYIERVRENASSLLAARDTLGIFRRLVVDERVSSNTASFLRFIGFVHLYGASGIHLYSINLFLYRIVFFFARFVSWSPSFILVLARIFSIVSWFLIWMLAGFRPGLLRPVLVVGARELARIAGVRWRLLMPLVLALLFDLLVAVFRNNWAPGRWHYALAVGGGLVALEVRERKFRRQSAFFDHWVMAVGSWMTTAVFDLFHTGWVAAGTPVLSFLTIPAISLLIYPSTFFALFLDFIGAKTFSICLVSFLGDALNWYVICTARAAIFFETVFYVPLWAAILSACAAAIIVAFPSKRILFGVASACLMIRVVGGVLPISGLPVARAQAVHQLDVGQGDAALVVLGEGKGGLIDSGPRRAISWDGWIRAFAERNVFKLNWVLFSHCDSDHSGGFQDVRLIIDHDCIDGLGSGCFPFDIFRVGGAGRNSKMQMSFVPLVSGGGYLNFGDARLKDALSAVSWFKNVVDHSSASGELVMKISHHGGRSSVTRELLRMVRPSLVAISVGVGNRYGHPTFDTLRTIEGADLGIKALRTDRLGALSFR